MEFGVAAFSAAVTVALSKLCNVREKKLNLETDAELLSNKLGIITALVKDHAPKGGDFSWVKIELIAQLKRLAYDIEDCIDRFHAKLTHLEDFANEIRDLKVRSEHMSSEIIGLAATLSVMGPTEQRDAVVPTESQYPPGGNLHCLLYLSLFPPNHPVRTKPLIRRWLAEGLVEREVDAVKNLRDFTNDSSIMGFIQRSNNGKVKRCQPTADTLENIAQLSLAENFILVCDGTAQQQGQEARRLSVHPPVNVHLNLPENLSRIRTLAVFSAGATNLASYEDVLDFTRYGVLRVLDLKECAHLSDGHIQAMCNQVLMKYLSINLGNIKEITRKIGDLDQLETLDLSGTQTVTVFKEVLMLPKLKHLFGRFQLSRTDTFIPGWLLTSGLQEFLKRKSKLETLAGFVTNQRLGFPQLLSLMKQLRKVKIWFESNASERNLKALSKAITEFIGAGVTQPDLNRSLSIEFEECSGEYVNNIGRVAGKLDSLKLRGKLSQFPQFVAQSSVIEELCLWSTGLSWEHIRDGLSRVRGLKYLKLVEDNLGRLDILSEAEHLKAIERICIVCTQTLEVAITARPLPSLVSVHILCQDLHDIPDNPLIEIIHMAKLHEVALHHQVKGTTKDELLRIAKGHPNKPDVLFLGYP